MCAGEVSVTEMIKILGPMSLSAKHIKQMVKVADGDHTGEVRSAAVTMREIVHCCRCLLTNLC